MKKAYLAGPEVFLADALDIAQAKQALCSAYGFEGLAPLDGEVTTAGGPEALAGAIYDKNVAMIRRSDLVIANLTPFRGLVMDPGTAFEIGFACALGLPVFGYANTDAGHFRRVADAGPLRPRPGRPEVQEDADGLAVEDFGLFENLMIDVPIRRLAGTVDTGAVPRDRLYGDLSVFERCLARAARTLSRG
ncbi:nucleoside 2-deoxyribosyltransferase [Marinibaculum pumilum]|uniref:Nucleoside 2-deoxyribosyltransferase n=1 Tax=Marinibaculum pumilum TaxID=1766165 RepID=A0ABV7L637_9PROT